MAMRDICMGGWLLLHQANASTDPQAGIDLYEMTAVDKRLTTTRD